MAHLVVITAWWRGYVDDLQRRRNRARGRWWRHYLFGESVYIVLSLAAKSALAWQVFAGTLAS